MEFPVLIALLTGLLGIVFLWIKGWRKRSKLPAGPPGWPLVGNALQLDPLYPQKTLSELSYKYGEVFSLSAFGNPIVVCNSFDAIWEVLVSKSTDFAGRPQSFTTNYIHNGASDTGFADFSPTWNRRKKIFMTNIKMHGDGLHNLELIMVDIINELLSDIQNTDQKPFDPMELVQLALANTLTLMLFGSKFRQNDPDFKSLLIYMEWGRKIMGPSLLYMVLNTFPWLRHLPFEGCQRLDGFLNGFLRGWIPRQCKKRETQKSSDKPACVLDGIVKQYEEDLIKGADYPIEWKHVVAMCQNFMTAGMQTSGGTIYALLATLTGHPDIQAKAQAEIDHVLGDNKATLADKEVMPYNIAVQDEIMRYAVIVPLALPHKTTKDTYVRGHFIPKDTEVWPNIWHLCHDPTFWEDPWAFRPERFLNEQGEIFPIDHPKRKCIITFGAGRRVCAGEVLAKNRLFLFVTSLLQKFTFKPVSDDQMPIYDPRTYTMGVIVRPSPYQIRAIPRD